jgi:triphosphoribosyl-dephospho-CoA synthase
MSDREKAKHIQRCLELAILLEASTHKPGNVSVVTDFEHTRYEHFLASAVAAASSFEAGANRGIAVSEERFDVAKIGIGAIIKNCIVDIAAWQHGGNTLLGTVILLSPIAAAAGMTMHDKQFDPVALRRNLKLIIESTTAQDAVDVYDAITIASPSGLGKRSDMDVNDPTSKERILREKISLFNIFEIAEKYDTICSEYVNNFHITFDLAYPSLSKHLKKIPDPSTAILQSFLEVLAVVPDTFIARKATVQKAREVSSKAERIVKLGGVETSSGRKALHTFDYELRKESNLLNPGTTADVIAAALAVCILEGYRP